MSSLSLTDLRRTYENKRVLVTGHTGFKGSWLTLWLSELGAQVFGYALEPEEARWMFLAANLSRRCQHRVGDVRDQSSLERAVGEAKPDYVFHLAAQSLVRRSYPNPLETLDVNVMGTARLLDVLRRRGERCAVVVVTSDKCYENNGWSFGYREVDPMGGHDPYSMSKGACELLVASFRRSYFGQDASSVPVRLASARAGNVVGGGDWSTDRIVPDGISALSERRPIPVRNPNAVRPWQHVLEPLSGYLLLGARLASANAGEPEDVAEAWNFGPQVDSARPVSAVVEELVRCWGAGSWEHRADKQGGHEANLLRLSVEKAHARLGWSPRWSFEQTMKRTVEWYQAQAQGATAATLDALSVRQVEAYVEAS